MPRIEGGTEADRLSMQQDLTLKSPGGIDAVEDLHQRGLTRAVFTNQGMDLLGPHPYSYARQGLHRGEALDDAAQLQREGRL